MRLSGGLKAAMLTAVMFAAAPVFAQEVSEAEIDALIGNATPEAALALARSQAAEGDLLGAAATLERALLYHPKAQRVRLYYVSLLCRLGDTQTARYELAKTGGRRVDGDAWAEVTAACGDTRPAAPASGRRLGGTLSAGVTYDSDLANALLVQLNLPGALPPGDGASFAGSAYVSGRAPIGGAFVYGSGSAFTRNGLSRTNADYQSGELILGIGARTGSVGEFAIGGIVRHFRIDGDPYVTDLGGEISYALLMDEARLTLRGEVVQQDFVGSTALFSRNGMRYDASLVYYRGGTNSFWLGAAYEHKDAETARTGYAGGRVYAGTRRYLSKGGTYAALNGSLRYIEFGDEPGFVPVHETQYYLRGALGVPLGPNGLNLEAAGSYTRRNYNALSTFRDYENVGGELRLVWNFGN